MSRDTPRQEVAAETSRGNGTHDGVRPLQKEGQFGMRDSGAVRAAKKDNEDPNPRQNVTELKDYVRYLVLALKPMPPSLTRISNLAIAWEKGRLALCSGP